MFLLVFVEQGRGGGGEFGCVSLCMCHSHSFLSGAMCSQFLRSPLGFCFSTMMRLPVLLHFLVTCSLVSSGSRAFKLLTIAFLLVERTPAFGLGFGIQAVMRSLGGWVSGARAIFPR